jgi:hypothetical protein
MTVKFGNYQGRFNPSQFLNLLEEIQIKKKLLKHIIVEKVKVAPDSRITLITRFIILVKK